MKLEHKSSWRGLYDAVCEPGNTNKRTELNTVKLTYLNERGCGQEKKAGKEDNSREGPEEKRPVLSRQLSLVERSQMPYKSVSEAMSVAREMQQSKTKNLEGNNNKNKRNHAVNKKSFMEHNASGSYSLQHQGKAGNTEKSSNVNKKSHERTVQSAKAESAKAESPCDGSFEEDFSYRIDKKRMMSNESFILEQIFYRKDASTLSVNKSIQNTRPATEEIIDMLMVLAYMDLPEHNIESLPRVLAASVGRNIIDVEKGIQAGQKADVELGHKIKAVSNKAIRALIEELTDSEENLKKEAEDLPTAFLMALGTSLGFLPDEKALCNAVIEAEFQGVRRERLSPMIGLLEVTLVKILQEKVDISPLRDSIVTDDSFWGNFWF